MQVRGLGFSYSDKMLFQNLNLDFAESSTTLIQGPSGCGKSTFLKLLAELLPLQDGEVIRGTADSKTGYLHQDCHVIEHWSLSENLSLVEPDRDLQKQMMQKMNLEMSLDKKAETLSGGERQRLCLARLFLQKADIILLDEPTAHLDDEQVASVLSLLKTELAGKIILVVSHDARLHGFADKTLNWLKK
jgi:ABC-type lipoprotein export system ATPase subunit